MTKLDTAQAEMPAPAERSRDPLDLKVIVVLLLAVAIFLRFWCKSDMWLDVALTVNVARLPVRQIGPWLRHDGAPPLFYWMLHYWMKLFGTSDLGARSLSGVFSVASLPLAWFCGKRIGGRTTAWIAVFVLAANPFAFAYATSSRMYAFEAFLVFAGILAVRRAFDEPTVGRVALLGVLTALLLYTQYWGIYIGLALALFLAATARVSQVHRTAAVRMLIALAVGAATFIPWIPSFLYQAKHTGTPWAKPSLPPIPIGATFQDFAGGITHQGWILLIGFIVFMFLGVFGTPIDRWHIDIDLHGQTGVRWEAIIGAAALVIGTSAAWASRSAFEPRYASIVFPFFVLVVAQGITCFVDRRLRAWILVLVVVLGFVGGLHNTNMQRTSAGVVGALLHQHAKPGDVVFYCPDQVGPSVHRLAPKGLDEVTYPRLLPPGLVDWVDYKRVLAQHRPAVVAQQVLERAGSHPIWYVSAPGYQTHVGTCDALSNALQRSRRMVVLANSPATSEEKPGLKEFLAP